VRNREGGCNTLELLRELALKIAKTVEKCKDSLKFPVNFPVNFPVLREFEDQARLPSRRLP